MPDPILDRQFYCSIKTKPNDTKDLELFSPLPPSRIVDASKLLPKSDKDSKRSIIINKIEYLDGSVWQRQGWNPATFSFDAHEQSGGREMYRVVKTLPL